MKVKIAVCSSVGMKRKINQDNFYVNGYINKKTKSYICQSFITTSHECVCCICDGMGGEKHGEIASLLAVQKLKTYNDKYRSLFNKYEKHINVYVQSANNSICKYIQSNNNERMGSTLSLLCISQNAGEAVAANVGDSKIFLFRNNMLKKMTEDHNQAQSLVNLGIISDDEARTHKSKSKLTQHLGIFANEMIIVPFISDEVMIKKGDIFVICSDGLTDMLNNDEIINVLSKRYCSMKKVSKLLVAEANKKGGNDNITVVVVKIK